MSPLNKLSMNQPTLNMNLFISQKRPSVKTWFVVLLALHFLSSLNVLAADIPDDQWVDVVVKSDPMMNIVTAPADVITKGMWSTVKAWPIVGIHAAVLPNGKILSFGSDGKSINDPNKPYGVIDTRFFDLWDPTMGFGDDSHLTTYSDGKQDSFCSSLAYLTNGELLISGGTRTAGDDKKSLLYSPLENTGTPLTSNFADERWYGTMINLPDGRPIMMGGMLTQKESEMSTDPVTSDASGFSSPTPEIYEVANGNAPSQGVWRSLNGALSLEAFGSKFLRTSYPRAWVAPSGKVFGISQDQMWYLDPNANAGEGSIELAGYFKVSNGQSIYSLDDRNKIDKQLTVQGSNELINTGPTSSAVMYDVGKILQVGGNGGYNGDKLPASNLATVININQETPTLTEQSPMVNFRRYSNSVVLANGQVVVTGGVTLGNMYEDEPLAQPVYAAEIWTPTENDHGNWTLGANASKYRGYHSFTVLMPNGTVLSTGGGVPGGKQFNVELNKFVEINQFNSEIFYPPYLFEADGDHAHLAPRPVIQRISGLSYLHSAPMQFDMAPNNTVDKLVLIGLSTGTHSWNTGQRRIPLNFSQNNQRVTTEIPNANLTPPGYYQVVALNANGVPSLGTIIKIEKGSIVADNTNPSVALILPANGSAYNQGQVVGLSAYAADEDVGDAISKVEIYDGANLINVDYAEPYEYQWQTTKDTAVGTHVLTVKSYDSNGGVGVSPSPLSITINANNPPSINITAPYNGATFVQDTTINVTVTAKDADKGGKISKVELYDGDTLIATKLKAPYSVKLPFTGLGYHAIKAKAYDNKSAVSTATSSVQVTDKKPSNAKLCGKQNKPCVLPGGVTARVWYGAKTSWLNKTNLSSGFTCGNAIFAGDPILKVAKSCYYVVTSTTQPSSTTYCAAQSKLCDIKSKIPSGGSATVWFGVENLWFNKSVTTNITCAASKFGGDPLPGKAKTCVFVVN